MPMNPPWPSDTRPNRPITDQEVYINDQIRMITMMWSGYGS